MLAPERPHTPPDLLEAVARAVEDSPWIPEVPTMPQLHFLAAPEREKLYGGAAGGGKSSALLMDALLGVELPDYAAILFRRTFPDLALPGAIMDRSKEWLMGTAAKWNENEKTWTFPSGATLSFGYLEHEKHKYRYQGAEFQYIGFDELTQFPYSQYSYLRSRLRKTADSSVVVRMGNATNPGGVGHDWVYDEFVKGVASDRVFIPAKLGDNPHLDQAEYEKSLEGLDEITREQLLKGRWVRDETGHPFKRAFFEENRYHIEEAVSGHVVGRWISWDTALKDTEGSAYNVGVVVELLTDYRLRIREVVRFKATFPELVPQMESLAARWSYDRLLRGVVIEDKSSGISAYQTLDSAAPGWLRDVLALFDPGSYSKLSRWSQAALWCQRGCVLLPHPSENAPWLYDLEGELYAVPDAEYKDTADAFSQAIIYLENLLADGYRTRLHAA